MWNSGLDKAQAGIKIAGRNINNLRYADDTTLMVESKEELKSLLMKVKEESEKAGLKLSFWKTKIMASGLITSWQIDGITMEAVTTFIFLGSKITADGDCSHEIKRSFLLGRKVMTNLDSIFKSRGRETRLWLSELRVETRTGKMPHTFLSMQINIDPFVGKGIIAHYPVLCRFYWRTFILISLGHSTTQGCWERHFYPHLQVEELSLAHVKLLIHGHWADEWQR